MDLGPVFLRIHSAANTETDRARGAILTTPEDPAPTRRPATETRAESAGAPEAIATNMLASGTRGVRRRASRAGRRGEGVRGDDRASPAKLARARRTESDNSRYSSAHSLMSSRDPRSTHICHHHDETITRRVAACRASDFRSSVSPPDGFTRARAARRERARVGRRGRRRSASHVRAGKRPSPARDPLVGFRNCPAPGGAHSNEFHRISSHPSPPP